MAETPVQTVPNGVVIRGDNWFHQGWLEGLLGLPTRSWDQMSPLVRDADIDAYTDGYDMAVATHKFEPTHSTLTELRVQGRVLTSFQEWREAQYPEGDEAQDPIVYAGGRCWLNLKYSSITIKAVNNHRRLLDMLREMAELAHFTTGYYPEMEPRFDAAQALLDELDPRPEEPTS